MVGAATAEADDEKTIGKGDDIYYPVCMIVTRERVPPYTAIGNIMAG